MHWDSGSFLASLFMRRFLYSVSGVSDGDHTSEPKPPNQKQFLAFFYCKPCYLLVKWLVVFKSEFDISVTNTFRNSWLLVVQVQQSKDCDIYKSFKNFSFE